MLRIAGVEKESTVDGEGIRYVIFTQGCPHRCKGCHNPQTHDYTGGYLIELDELMDDILKNPLLDGVTFSGGEPFTQAKELVPLASMIKKAGLSLWIYTGYTIEELEKLSENDDDIRTLMLLADVIVDGGYIEEERDLDLKFRGSRNQRIINMLEYWKTRKLSK